MLKEKKLIYSNLIKFKIYSKSFKIYPKLLRIEHIMKKCSLKNVLGEGEGEGVSLKILSL